MSKSILGTETEQNLRAAFAGESQARTRYNLFAAKAQKQGFTEIAEEFNETAGDEFEHAARFFRFLHGVRGTRTNLETAACGEHEEWTTIYPRFAAVALREGFPEIAEAFTETAAEEKIHEQEFLHFLCELGVPEPPQ